MRDLIDYIEFTDDLKLGIQNIDDQHKKIIQLYNLFIIEVNHMVIDDDTSAASIGEITEIPPKIHELIDELMNYINFHFVDEEEFMAEINYSGYDEHLEKHLDIVDELSYYYDELKDGSLDIIAFALFFQNWIINHIKKDDTDYMEEYKKT